MVWAFRMGQCCCKCCRADEESVEEYEGQNLTKAPPEPIVFPIDGDTGMREISAHAAIIETIRKGRAVEEMMSLLAGGASLNGVRIRPTVSHIRERVYAPLREAIRAGRADLLRTMFDWTDGNGQRIDPVELRLPVPVHWDGSDAESIHQGYHGPGTSSIIDQAWRCIECPDVVRWAARTYDTRDPVDVAGTVRFTFADLGTLNARERERDLETFRIRFAKIEDMSLVAAICRGGCLETLRAFSEVGLTVTPTDIVTGFAETMLRTDHDVGNLAYAIAHRIEREGDVATARYTTLAARLEASRETVLAELTRRGPTPESVEGSHGRSVYANHDPESVLARFATTRVEQAQMVKWLQTHPRAPHGYAGMRDQPYVDRVARAIRRLREGQGVRTEGRFRDCLGTAIPLAERLALSM
jgi:hypothetical protein